MEKKPSIIYFDGECIGYGWKEIRYGLRTNAYVVKPVDFQEFVDAIKELELFWAVINQPSPGSLSPLRLAN